jgi:hypothetical protein
MPLASTADPVFAGITHIHQGLLKPAPMFHLPPIHAQAACRSPRVCHYDKQWAHSQSKD